MTEARSSHGRAASRRAESHNGDHGRARFATKLIAQERIVEVEEIIPEMPVHCAKEQVVGPVHQIQELFNHTKEESGRDRSPDPGTFLR